MSKVWVFNEEQLDRALASYIGADVATGDAVDKIKHFLNSGSASVHGLMMECNPKPPATTPPFAPSPRAGEGQGERS